MREPLQNKVGGHLQRSESDESASVLLRSARVVPNRGRGAGLFVEEGHNHPDPLQSSAKKEELVRVVFWMMVVWFMKGNRNEPNEIMSGLQDCKGSPFRLLILKGNKATEGILHSVLRSVG